MFRTDLRCLVVVAMIALSAAATRGDEKSAGAALRDRGLRKSGLYWILPGEKELGDRFQTFGRRDRGLSEARKRRDAADAKIKEAQRRLPKLYAQRIRLNRQLRQAGTVRENNELVAQINELTDKIILITDTLDRAEHDNPARTALAQLEREYLAELHDLRRLVNETETRYAALDADGIVRTALDELVGATGRGFKLGPRTFFHQKVRDLERLESAVKTETVELQRQGNVFLVNVLLNGQHDQAMVLDTGAGIVLIPSTLAAKIGLDPGEDDPVIHLMVADGRMVEGRRMLLESVAVGGAEASDVACAVLPPGAEDLHPLLGGTFLRHFVYQIDPQAGTVTFTRLELPKK
ncbi:MAG: hypothetical protein GY778_09890 [bacterium]|nr:hypothetical protein [bacterium]